MKGFLEFRCSNLKNVYIILRFRDCTYWDKIFTNIPRMSTEWSLTFEKYRISDKTDDWGSIMYFTNLGNISQFDERVPAMFSHFLMEA